MDKVLWIFWSLKFSTMLTRLNLSSYEILVDDLSFSVYDQMQCLGNLSFAHHTLRILVHLNLATDCKDKHQEWACFILSFGVRS